jgi:hypothetical protein
LKAAARIFTQFPARRGVFADAGFCCFVSSGTTKNVVLLFFNRI